MFYVFLIGHTELSGEHFVRPLEPDSVYIRLNRGEYFGGSVYMVPMDKVI